MFAQTLKLATLDHATISELRNKSCCYEGSDSIQSHLSNAISSRKFKLRGSGARSVSMWHRSVDLDGVKLHYIDYESDAKSLLVQSDASCDDVSLEIPLLSPSVFVTDDREIGLKPGAFSVLTGDRSLQQEMGIKNNYITVTLSKNWIENYLARRKLPLLYRCLSFDPKPRLLAENYILLSSIMSAVLQDTTDPDHWAKSIEVTAHLKELITALVLSASPEYNNIVQAKIGKDEAPEYVKRAEEFMLKHLSCTINLEEVVRYSGASRRTLHDGFRKHRGTTPMALLKSYRMEAAKTDLENPSLKCQQVTTIAMNYGFYHLGRFSKEFREFYGVLPSEVRPAV